MPTTRKTITRRPIRRITNRAVDLFDEMEALPQDSDPWWKWHAELHSELRLRPWEWPAYSDYDAKAMARYDALKAASDARKPK
jgi:hypothetical protein